MIEMIDTFQLHPTPFTIITSKYQLHILIYFQKAIKSCSDRIGTNGLLDDCHGSNLQLLIVVDVVFDEGEGAYKGESKESSH